MPLPIGLEDATQAVPGLREVATAGGRALDGWEGAPVAALRLKRIGAQPAEQDIVGRGILGVVLEAGALEGLAQRRAAHGRDRVAKHRQPAVAAPVVQEAALERLASFGEANRRRLAAGQSLAAP